MNRNASAIKESVSSDSYPQVQSPVIKPTIPCNGTSVTSPVLDALSANKPFSASPAPSASEWTKSLAGLSSSPGNLISIMGESPPTQPASFEEPRGIHGRQNQPTFTN